MKSSWSSFYFKNKETTKVRYTSCSEKDKKKNRLEATILKMEAEIERLSLVIEKEEYFGNIYIAFS